jgi:hypothetical protein
MRHCLQDNVKSQSTLHPANAGQISKLKIRRLPLKLTISFINAAILKYINTCFFFISLSKENMIKNDEQL